MLEDNRILCYEERYPLTVVSKLTEHEIKYLKKEEWLRLIESVDNYRDKLIVQLLYSTGMRVGELARLKVEGIDFHDRKFELIALDLDGTLLSDDGHIPEENSRSASSRIWRQAHRLLH